MSPDLALVEGCEQGLRNRDHERDISDSEDDEEASFQQRRRSTERPRECSIFAPRSALCLVRGREINKDRKMAVAAAD